MAGKKLLVPKSRCAVVSATNFENMVEIRIHGRGGQGVVTAADLTAMAAFKEGHYAQAFPSFGSERTGAPVVSFCRISDDPIRSREPVLEPDVVNLTGTPSSTHPRASPIFGPTGSWTSSLRTSPRILGKSV